MWDTAFGGAWGCSTQKGGILTPFQPGPCLPALGTGSSGGT